MRLKKKTRLLLSRRYIVALLSLFCMGTGQLFNGQIIKGFLFLLFNFAVMNSIAFIRGNIYGLITLGEPAMEDHSLFLLIYGVLTVFLLLIINGIYIINIRHAYKNGLLREQGKEPPGFKESLKNKKDTGFSNLVLSPGLTAILCFTVLPLIYSILIALTNYDLYHLPPAN